MWNMNVDQKFLHYQARKVYKILKYNGKGCHESVRLSIHFPTTSLQQSNFAIMRFPARPIHHVELEFFFYPNPICQAVQVT